MSVTIELGAGAVLYRGAADADLDALSAVTNVQKVNVDLKTGTFDTTTRDTGGFRTKRPTFKELTVTASILYEKSNADVVALIAALLNDTKLRIAALLGPMSADGVAAEAGSDGPLGNFYVTGGPRSEELESGVTYDFTFELANWEEWVIDGLQST